MRLHARTLKVRAATLDLEGQVWTWMKEHDLTYAEALEGLLQSARRIVVYQIRMERHPDDPEKKGDEA